jgi:regulator of protease activity HflC (stomatin/prohibitin superfamily)
MNKEQETDEEQKKEGKNEEEEEIEIKKKTDVTFWVIIAISYITLFALEYFFSAKKMMIFDEEWNWGWAIFFAQILYTIFSFKTVGPTELGAILFFGKPIKPVSSGLVFVPFLICQLVKETRLTMQDELPGDPEKTYRGDGIVPAGMFPPIRIPFANITEGDDPLYRRVTAEVSPIIRYRISDYIIFLTTIGSIDAAKKQMEDATIAFCMRELTKIPVAEALITLQKFNLELQVIIEKMVRKWGIEIKTAQIKVINFHHDLNQAIANVPKSEFEAKVLAKKAAGEKTKRQLEGEGSGLAEKAILDGRTAGLKTMREELGLESGLVLSAETARAITQNPGQKTVIIGTKGFADIIGIATGIQKTIKTETESEAQK